MLLVSLRLRRSFARVRPGFTEQMRRELGAAFPRRWIVGGMMGAGKTTFARSLAARIGVPHVEIDLFGVPPSDATEQKVLEAVADAREGWVVEANPWQIPTPLAKEAEVAVLLDYDDVVNYVRLLRRGLGRWRSQGLSWAGFKRFVVDEAVLDLGRIVYRYGQTNRRGWREAGMLEGIDRASTVCIRCVSPAELRLVHDLVVDRVMHGGLRPASRPPAAFPRGSPGSRWARLVGSPARRSSKRRTRSRRRVRQPAPAPSHRSGMR